MIGHLSTPVIGHLSTPLPLLNTRSVRPDHLNLLLLIFVLLVPSKTKTPPPLPPPTHTKKKKSLQEAGTGSADESPPRNAEFTYESLSGYPRPTTIFSTASRTDATRGWCLAGTFCSMLSTRARLAMRWQRRRGKGRLMGRTDGTGSTSNCWTTASYPAGVKSLSKHKYLVCWSTRGGGAAFQYVHSTVQ